MKLTKVLFTDGEENYTTYMEANGSLFEHIEDQLYILWELTSVGCLWKYDLAIDGYVLFSYHNCEFFSVSYAPLQEDESVLQVTVTPHSLG